RVDAHWIEILHITDSDHGIRRVAYYLILELFPSQHRALYEHLTDRAGQNTSTDDLIQLLGCVCDTPSRATKREGWADDQRELVVACKLASFLNGMHDRAFEIGF